MFTETERIDTDMIDAYVTRGYHGKKNYSYYLVYKYKIQGVFSSKRFLPSKLFSMFL